MLLGSCYRIDTVDQAMDRRAEPALDAWQRLKAYLDRTLGG